MKIRNKKTGEIGSSNKFNMHAMSEIIVYYENDCDSDFISNFDVYLDTKKEWKPLSDAFRDNDIITDNYNSTFREPFNESERRRGWYD